MFLKAKYNFILVKSQGENSIHIYHVKYENHI